MSVELPIAAVVVHRDGALVERTGRVAATGGRVVIGGLPLLLDERSLRVEVEGAGLLGVGLDLDVLGEERGDESAVRAAYDKAERALHSLEWERDALYAERSAHGVVEPASPPEEPERVPSPQTLRAWAELQEAIGSWTADLDDRLRALERRLWDAREERARRALDLDRASTEAAWRRWQPLRRAVLRLSGDGEIGVRLSYRVPGATWSPAYALHADDGFRSGRLVVRAMVAQATGEDWRGVKLALSSASSRRAVAIPELRAVRLGAAQPVAKAWRDLPADLDALFPAELSEFAPAPPPKPPPPAPRPAPKKARGRRQQEEAKREIEQAFDEMPLLADAEVAGAVTLEPAPERLAPQAVATSRAKSKSVGVFGAMAGMAGAALDMATRGGGAPSGAPLAPASLPTSFARAAPADAGLDVGEALLDYGNLRLAGWAAPHEDRGRLRPGGLADLAAEAGVPEAWRPQVAARFEALRDEASRATAQALPPHHVVPGPIDDADFRWDAQDTVDLVSDGQFHSVGVFESPLSLDVSYRAVPRSDPRAFRTLTAKMQASVPLVAGPVDVFVDGALEITLPWKGSGRGADLRLGLGPEDRLRVARNVRYREETAGLLRGSRRLHTEIDVEVASGLSRAVEVEVLDRVPMNSDDKTEVALVASSPTAAQWKGDPDGHVLGGGVRQVLSLPAGGKAQATLHYTVTLGARDELIGGDRRG